jgi:hypothetical protein
MTNVEKRYFMAELKREAVALISMMPFARRTPQKSVLIQLKVRGAARTS